MRWRLYPKKAWLWYSTKDDLCLSRGTQALAKTQEFSGHITTDVVGYSYRTKSGDGLSNIVDFRLHLRYLEKWGPINSSWTSGSLMIVYATTLGPPILSSIPDTKHSPKVFVWSISRSSQQWRVAAYLFINRSTQAYKRRTTFWQTFVAHSP